MSAPAGFWDWSLEAYERDGAADRLIELQDRFALNVNVLLWCVWCATRYAEVPEFVIRKAADLASLWTRDVTGQLRSARRALKSPPRQAIGTEALRERVKEAELEAERVEQHMLETLANDSLLPSATADARATARRNLAAYVSLAGAPRISGFSMLPVEEIIDRLLPDSAQDEKGRA